MNTKAKGRRFERLVRDSYRTRGYLVCTSAASLGADLIVLKAGCPTAVIECKAGRLYGKERDAAIKKISALARQAGCVGILAEKDGKTFSEFVIS